MHIYLLHVLGFLWGLRSTDGFIAHSGIKLHTLSITELYLKSDEFRKRKQELVTIKDVVKKFEKDATSKSEPVKQKKGSKRTRKKKENPQQTYVYAAQKKLSQRVTIKTKSDEETGEEDIDIQLNLDQNNPITIARNMGMNPVTQSCDAVYKVQRRGDDGPFHIVPSDEPRVVGKLMVGGDDGDGASSMFAYFIEKPIGWGIIEGTKKKSKRESEEQSLHESPSFDEQNPVEEKRTPIGKKLSKVKYYDYESQSFDTIEYDQKSILSAMTQEEIDEFERDGGFKSLNLSDAGAFAAKVAYNAMREFDDDDDIDAFVLNVMKEDDAAIQEIDSIDTLESSILHATAILDEESRPSIVSWLKKLKAEEGTPIRGGKFWVALAGAVEADDSGIVLICPKEKVNNIHVENAKYFTVVGNGKFFSPKGKKNYQKGLAHANLDEAKVEVVAKLRKGRLDDVVFTGQVFIPEGVSTSNDVVQICQKELLDGIRGDYAANPFDRRSSRRMIHCSSILASSLTHDDSVEVSSDLPEDIRIVSDRRNHHEFIDGSFLGRRDLRINDYTNAYRELNGAADGYPGWIVDRFDKWLLVQHDEMHDKGPLPSLHDGYTAGVYYFPTNRDRSITGPKLGIKPSLLEGRPAPDAGFEIKENGIKYLVNFNDLSTGIFLDQRNQRAWLARCCSPDTRVLNCFAHCGAFSIAAAMAGAETVSLDLDKKWLDRIKPQLLANGIQDVQRHDSIYGDCFDWLERFRKRGQQFDIVILDPPSTSVGKAKKRWSAKNDYDELVALAAPLVKKGGLLLTTTNSAQIHPIKFARQCKKGLVDAGFSDARLEKVAAMPSDFPLVGPQNVKNLIWRIY